MKPLEREGRLSISSDEDLKPGSDWESKIEEELRAAEVVVLLVSPEFLASDFIHERELTPVLKRAAEKGVQICWVLVRPCNWEETALKRYQAVGPPGQAFTTDETGRSGPAVG